MKDIRFERLGAKHRNSAIAIFNHYVENSTAAYRDKRVENGFFENFTEYIDLYPGYAIVDGDDTILGFCLLEPFMPISTFKEVAEITYFLHKDHTGTGIGTRVLGKLEEDAKAMGISKLVANISSDNDKSIRFHVRNGFVEYGRLKDAGCKFGNYFDIVYMVKEI
jgi:L-amino acid N-acyltransferase YncA